jgi:hypothetical protein
VLCAEARRENIEKKGKLTTPGMAVPFIFKRILRMELTFLKHKSRTFFNMRKYFFIPKRTMLLVAL